METKASIVLRFTVYNGEKQKLETLDTNDLVSMKTAKDCLHRCVEVMTVAKVPQPSNRPSKDNIDQTYKLFGLRDSHLYAFTGIILKQETLLVQDLDVLGL